MAQSMRMDGLAHTGLHPRVVADPADRFPPDWLGRIGSREEPGTWFIPLPILPEEGEEPRGEHDIPILLAFPLLDAEHHAGTVDISDLEVTEFGDPQTGGIEGGEHGSAFEMARGAEQRRDFGLTQDRRERFRPLGLGNVGEHLGLAERDVIEKAQGTDGLHDEGPGDVLLLDEIELILADLLGAKPRRGGPEMLSKLGHTAEIAFDRLRRIVAQLE